MKFVCSLTSNPKFILDLLDWEHGQRLFDSMLISPLSSTSGLINLAHALHDEGRSVWFDSGGYSVQRGKLSYDEMVERLDHVYRKHSWADVYVMPDIPLTKDVPDADKLLDIMIEDGVKFWGKLPSRVRDRSLFVIHGTSKEHIERCYSVYAKIGAPMLGFGSFSATGKDNGTSQVTNRNLEVLKLVGGIGGVHAFGIGSPAAVYLLYKIGFASSDSSGWLHAARMNKISMPFMAYRPVSGHTAISNEEFFELSELTGHECLFTFDELQESRWKRTIHNLRVINETVTMINNGFDPSCIMEQWSRFHFKKIIEL